MIDMTSQMMNHISNLNHENQRISNQLSTGKALQNGSDNSILYGKVINIEDEIRVNEGLKLQIDNTIAQNNVADSSIGELKTSIDLIKVDLMKSLNYGMDDGARHALAVNIQGIRENLFTIANTTINGEQIFSGSDTTAVTFTKDVNYITNGKISYGGDGLLRKVAVEDSTYRDRGITGFDTLMYNASTAGDSEVLEFTANERVIDEHGQEWKFRQVDTISLGGTLEADDKYKVTIGSKTIIATGANETALLESFKQQINLDVDTSKSVVADIVDGKLVLTAKTSDISFKTSVATVEADDSSSDSQYMLLNSGGKLLQYERDGTIKEPVVNRIDTLTVVNIEDTDVLKVTIDGIEISVTSGNDVEADMAEAIKNKINQNSTLFEKYYVTRSGDSIVIKPRSEDDTYTVSTDITNTSGGSAPTFNKASAITVTQPTDVEEITVDVVANRTDTIGVGGTFESGDKFTVTINGKEVVVDAETDNATTASKIVTELNTNSDTKDVVKAIIDPDDDTKVIITGRTSTSEFYTSVKTTQDDGTVADAQIFTISTTVATGDDATTIAKYKTQTGEITGSRFLEAKHSYFEDLNIMINALNGYTTNIDGTKGVVADDTKRSDILRDSLGKTSSQYDATNVGHSELGGRNHAFNVALERVTSKVVHYNILLQEVGGADLSKLAMESKSLEMTYQALYSTVSKMHSLSLLNFLK